MFAEWSNSGELLAVAGRVSLTQSETDVNYHHLNRIKFFSDSGNPVYTVLIPFYKVGQLGLWLLNKLLIIRNLNDTFLVKR